MNFKGYLFTINKNNSFKLNDDEIKDVLQDLQIYFLDKSYNNFLVKKTILYFYINTVNKKIKQENFILSNVSNAEENDFIEIENKRNEKLKKLGLKPKQKRIVKLLIQGYSYEEVRRTMRLSIKQLENTITYLKRVNSLKQN